MALDAMEEHNIAIKKLTESTDKLNENIIQANERNEQFQIQLLSTLTDIADNIRKMANNSS